MYPGAYVWDLALLAALGLIGGLRKDDDVGGAVCSVVTMQLLWEEVCQVNIIPCQDVFYQFFGEGWASLEGQG